MPRKGRKWIDPKKATKFQLVHRSYEDPRYGDSQAAVRILAPIENPNLARKRLPDSYYEQQEKLIELVESYNQATTGGDGEDADEERLMAAKQSVRGPRQVFGDEDSDEEADRYYGEEDDEEGEEEEEEEGEDYDAHGHGEHGEEGDDLDRFADADEDEDDDLPPLEEDERKKAPSAAPTQKSGAAAKDVKGKAKGKAAPKGKAAGDVSAQEFELGEYGFDSNYNYAQHFKPMGVSGGVFMEAPPPKGTKKGQKPAAFALREDEEKVAKVLTTDIVDFLDDADIPDEIPDDVLAALNDPEAFESLTDDFIIAAEEGEEDGGEGGEGKRGKRKTAKKVHFDDDDDEYDGEYGEEDYDEDEDDEDLDALLDSLKANPEGNKRRERNEHEQIFDARFERALAEFDDDEIGELQQEAEEIKGMTTVDQLRPVLKEFISSRRRVKGIIGKKANDDDDTKSVSGASQKGQSDDRARASQAGDDQGEESEEEEEEKDEFIFVEAEEPRDQWDCESITTTYTNTENHPTLIDDGPLPSRRRPPIVLSKKTGIPLGVLPTTQPKAKNPEEAVNMGRARPKQETKEEKRARKQQIKEARKANRERKKEIKGAFKEEELRQLTMQAKGQGQRVIRLK